MIKKFSSRETTSHISACYNLSFSVHFRGQVTAIRVVTLQMLKCHLFQRTFLQQFQPQ